MDGSLSLGRTMREIRLKRRIRQKDMAEMLGVSKPYYCQVERGNRRPSLKMVNDFMDKLDLSDGEVLRIAMRISRESKDGERAD